MLPNKTNTINHPHKYEQVPTYVDTNTEVEGRWRRPKTHQWTHTVMTVVLMVFSAAFGFAVSSKLHIKCREQYGSFSEITVDGNLQPQVRLNTIPRTFGRNEEFEEAPPSGPGNGNESEPVWDSLIPKGLGYISHPSIPSTSIPTVFHQLHCLYTIRRAYFAIAENPETSAHTTSIDSDLQRWDLGKPRKKHVAHCFDFLQQGLTCSADSTLEPAIDRDHEFLGMGFQRQCRDFEALKTFAEQHRVFESEGFLAQGMHIPGFD